MMFKNKNSKQRVNFSKNSEVAYFLWLKSGCPESIEEIAYFSMLQSGRPRGADRTIWNETKRRLEAHIRDNMGIPQPEPKVKKVNVTKSVDDAKIEDKAEVKKVVSNADKSDLKKSEANKTKNTKLVKKSVVQKLDNKNVISLKSVKAKADLKTKKSVKKNSSVVKKISAINKKSATSKGLDEKVLIMPVKNKLKKDNKIAVNNK